MKGLISSSIRSYPGT